MRGDTVDKLTNQIEEWLSEPWILALVIMGGSIFAAYLLSFVIRRTIGVLVRHTETDLDDQIIEALGRPIFMSVLLYGFSWAVEITPMAQRGQLLLIALLKTIAIWVWASAAFRIGHHVLENLGDRSRENAIIQPRTVPVFDVITKITVVAAAVYFIFVAWDIDVTAWLASAGIVGIAVGFAAKDTLANLFSGIFIIADAPYKIGDFIVLDDGLRGRVIRIGIRSTRVITRDDIEITIPNAVIGASKIVNESGGPTVKQRIRITVEVAYGSDIDRAKQILLDCAEHPHVERDPHPRVRFREFGASGLVHELFVWITEPAKRGEVQSDLNTAVYKALNAAGMEIPYSKHDVYIKQMPR